MDFRQIEIVGQGYGIGVVFAVADGGLILGLCFGVGHLFFGVRGSLPEFRDVYLLLFGIKRLAGLLANTSRATGERLRSGRAYRLLISAVVCFESGSCSGFIHS
jgi:hypothetical protein